MDGPDASERAARRRPRRRLEVQRRVRSARAKRRSKRRQNRSSRRGPIRARRGSRCSRGSRSSPGSRGLAKSVAAGAAACVVADAPSRRAAPRGSPRRGRRRSRARACTPRTRAPSLSAASTLARLASRSRVSSSARHELGRHLRHALGRLEALVELAGFQVLDVVSQRLVLALRLERAAGSPRTSSSVGARGAPRRSWRARPPWSRSAPANGPGKDPRGARESGNAGRGEGRRAGRARGVAAPDDVGGVRGVPRRPRRAPGLLPRARGRRAQESTAADVDYTRRVNGVAHRTQRAIAASRQPNATRRARTTPTASRRLPDLGSRTPPSQAESGRPRRRDTTPRVLVRRAPSRVRATTLHASTDTSRFVIQPFLLVISSDRRARKRGKRGVRGELLPSFVRASAPSRARRAALCPRAVPACDIRPFEHVAPSRARVAVLRAADFRRRGGSRGHPRFPRLRTRPPRSRDAPALER